LLLDVAGQHQRAADGAGKRLDATAEALPLIGEGDLRTLARQHPGDAPGDRMIVGHAHHDAAAAGHEPAAGRHAGLLHTCRDRHASSFLKTSDALVPPKPKLFDIAQTRPAWSMRWRTIGMPSASGSSVSILALSAMKSPSIIRRQ